MNIEIKSKIVESNRLNIYQISFRRGDYICDRSIGIKLVLNEGIINVVSVYAPQVA